MKRKICFLADSIFTIGGVQRVTAVVAKELSRRHEVTVVTFDDPASADRTLYGLDASPVTFRFIRYPSVSFFERFCCKAYSAVYRKLRLRGRRASDLDALSSLPSPLRRCLADELRRGGYDVVVGVHAPLAVRLATVSKNLPGVKTIGWIHNSFEALYGEGSLYIGPELLRHYVCQLGRLGEVVVLSRHDAEAYRRCDGRLQPRVVYNPLTLEPGPRSKGTSRRFLAVGRFSHRHKGFDLLIEAFHRFAQHDDEWSLDIVGEGPEEPLYRELIARYGLGRRVWLHPFTTRVQQYYSAAQVYVLSSRWEGFGLVLVEAMAHGLPVVSSDLPTSREIMGAHALYFANGNVDELAQRLSEATRMDWRRYSDEAIAVARRFRADGIMAEWEQLLANDKDTE